MILAYRQNKWECDLCRHSILTTKLMTLGCWACLRGPEWIYLLATNIWKSICFSLSNRVLELGGFLCIIGNSEFLGGGGKSSTDVEAPNQTNKTQRELRNQSSLKEAILTTVLPWGGCSAFPWVSGWVQPHLVHTYPVLLGAFAFWTEQGRTTKDCQIRKVIISYYSGFPLVWNSIYEPQAWAKTHVMWGVVQTEQKTPLFSQMLNTWSGSHEKADNLYLFELP